MKTRLPLILLSIIFLCSCSKLSKEAKEIVGTYYNSELSQNEPVMQLNKDGRCVVTAIRPGVLSYSVDGRWNVRNDSLIINIDPESLRFEGDSSLIGKIPPEIKRRVAEHSDLSLLLENEGVSYMYQRRND